MTKSKHNEKTAYIKTISECGTYAIITRDESGKTGLYKVDIEELPNEDVKKALKQ